MNKFGLYSIHTLQKFRTHPKRSHHDVGDKPMPCKPGV